MAPASLKESRLPLRVRSNGTRPGFKPGLATNPLDAQLAGFVIVGSRTGFPALSKQTGLTVGSVIPKRKFSESETWEYWRPALMLWRPFTWERSIRKPVLVRRRPCPTVSG